MFSSKENHSVIDNRKSKSVLSSGETNVGILFEIYSIK